jgi:hypothetical protein
MAHVDGDASRRVSALYTVTSTTASFEAVGQDRQNATNNMTLTIMYRNNETQSAHIASVFLPTNAYPTLEKSRSVIRYV